MKKDRDRHSRRHRARAGPSGPGTRVPPEEEQEVDRPRQVDWRVSRLGGSQTAVKKAWGANPGCSNEQDICQYDTRDASLGEATAFLEAPFNGKHFKVYKVVIEAAIRVVWSPARRRSPSSKRRRSSTSARSWGR